MEIPGYAIQEQIGQGGMAAVYRAVQESLGREVVLKVLDTSAASPGNIERFLNEGRLIASLKHPHIITIYDIGQSGSNVYISMEYVAGGDLKERMQNHVFAPLEALDLIAAIASALAAAHDSGIVHRDVKPGNILFRRDGTPLLSDFGIAKRLDADPNLTMAGMFIGSPNYMAPEQSEDGPLDGRADLYALGVILYEMLTGKRPYQADSVVEVIMLHKTAPVPRLPHGLEQFQPLLERMMAKSRNGRFRDAHVLIEHLERVRASERARIEALFAAHPDIERTDQFARRETPARRWPALRPLHWLLLVLLVLCLAGWGALFAVERGLRTVAVPRAVPADVPPSLPQPPAAPLDTAGADRAQVAAALAWLGQHSLDQYRLVEPPRDNAYYYFSRLLQLEPESATARAGLAEIAARYALLAERALAADRLDQAQAYVALGLQIDARNATLLQLKTLAARERQGFWAAVRSLWR